MNLDEWDIGEFVSMQIEEIDNTFQIILAGDIKYKSVILDKLNNIRISSKDLMEHDSLK